MYSEKHFMGYFYDYFDIKKFETKFYDLYDLLVNLENNRERIRIGSDCVCKEDLANLTELTRTLVGECTSLRIDLITDSSGYEEWVLANPDIVARDVWEECLYSKCTITYTLSLARDLNNKKKDCSIVYSLIKSIHSCDLKYDLKKSTKNCQIEYDIISKTKDCKITFDEYVEIIKCGGSIELVKNAINCGIGIEVNHADKCLDLTYNLKKYPIHCHE